MGPFNTFVSLFGKRKSQGQARGLFQSIGETTGSPKNPLMPLGRNINADILPCRESINSISLFFFLLLNAYKHREVGKL